MNEEATKKIDEAVAWVIEEVKAGRIKVIDGETILSMCDYEDIKIPDKRITELDFDFDDFYIEELGADSKAYIIELAQTYEAMRKMYEKTGDERIANLLKSMLPSSYKG